MPSLKFTQDTIESLKPPIKGREYFWDETTPGFGVRISSLGKKVWVAQYRVAGKSVMETVATIAELPSLKDARSQAMKSKLAARDGQNPVAEKRAKKQAEKKPDTFAEVFDRYVREYCRRNLRASTLHETERAFAHDILPTLGKRPLVEIKRGDLERLLDKKASTRDRSIKGITGGAGVMANRNLAKLKTFFRWCVRKELITVNPALAIDKLVKEVPRDRVLEDEEIVAVWHASETLGYPYEPVIKLLLLTGQRRSEVTDMHWAELNLGKRQWTIPRERAKNNRAHVVHLSPLAFQIIDAIPDTSDFVFSVNGKAAPTGFATLKPKLDKLVSDLLGHEPQPWVIHDLRRTVASGMAQIRVPPHVLDRILNHTGGTIGGVAAVYNRYEYLDERRDALNTWAEHVEKLVASKVKRVVLEPVDRRRRRSQHSTRMRVNA
jgi:integrase